MESTKIVRKTGPPTAPACDNAMAESFFATLKKECVHRTVYLTREHAMNNVARYIELRYNSGRLSRVSATRCKSTMST